METKQQFPLPRPDLAGSECPCPECVDLRRTASTACEECASFACHWWAGPGCIRSCACHNQEVGK